MKDMIKNTVILLAITLVAGLLLGVVYDITKEPIKEQELKAKQQACKEVFSAASDFEATEVKKIDNSLWAEVGYENQSIDEVMCAKDSAGELLGYVITVTSKEGYGGDIVFAVGVSLDGTVNGMSILSIAETAGLGMRADEVLKPQFANKQVSKFSYTKNGAVTDDQIDAISGATITTRAVTNGVNAALYYFQTELEGGSDNE